MRSRRALLLAGVLAVAAFAGIVSVRHVTEQVAVLRACDAADAGDWDAALSGTADRVGPDETGRVAAECRCRALLARGEPDACAELLEGVLASPEADAWTPAPLLATHLVNTRREQGRTLEAAELARRVAKLHPGDADLFYLELLTRSALEDETQLLRELAGRVPTGGVAAARMRASLANRHLLRGDPQAALVALGSVPPRGAGPALGRWFELRGMAQASSGDLKGFERTYADWRAAGGDPRELRARHALTLSIAGIGLADRTPVEMLREALAEPLADPALEEALTIRLILTLVTDDRVPEALAAYDTAHTRFALEGLSRGELERAAVHRELAAEPDARRSGRLRFEVESPPPGARLALSPPPDAPVDTAYERVTVPGSGRLELEREIDVAPVRWVLLDGGDRVRASGTASPRSGRSLRVAVRPGEARPTPSHPLAPLARSAGDGRRRVALLLLDCADWRIVQYLRERGELPVLDALLESGQRAVLASDPPLTAAALEALVWPERSAAPSTLGIVHRFGVELAGLSSVGENPFGALAWLLPEGRDLFSTVGAGRHAAANLLFAHGGIRSGRHALVTGPAGRERSVPLRTSARDLDAAERARFPALASVTRERDAVHLRTIAAELDVATEILRQQEVDLLALRVEPLDILSHAHFADAVRDGQDDGAGLLFSVYRYIDARLADVQASLDADDVLVVMSDHGIRTAMEHSPHALFVAAGAGIAPGRAAGQPDLRGVPRVLAELLGIDTTWPDTELSRFARALAGPPLARAGTPPHPAPTRP